MTRPLTCTIRLFYHLIYHTQVQRVKDVTETLRSTQKVSCTLLTALALMRFTQCPKLSALCSMRYAYLRVRIPRIQLQGLPVLISVQCRFLASFETWGSRRTHPVGEL